MGPLLLCCSTRVTVVKMVSQRSITIWFPLLLSIDLKELLLPESTGIASFGNLSI